MKWREGLIVSLFKKGDKEDPGNYRGITLVVGVIFFRVVQKSNHILYSADIYNNHTEEKVLECWPQTTMQFTSIQH